MQNMFFYALFVPPYLPIIRAERSVQLPGCAGVHAAGSGVRLFKRYCLHNLGYWKVVIRGVHRSEGECHATRGNIHNIVFFTADGSLKLAIARTRW